MCLVISVLLGALGINFYLNGFYMQAAITGLFSLGLMILMIRNFNCKNSGCSINQNKDDDTNASDLLDDIHSDKKKVADS